MGKYSKRMRLYYWTIVFIIIFFAFVGVLSIMLLLQHLGVIEKLGFMTLLSLISVSTIVCGLVSYYVGQRIVTPMVKLSAASKEVAKGNYTVRVCDSSQLEEVQTI